MKKALPLLALLVAVMAIPSISAWAEPLPATPQTTKPKETGYSVGVGIVKSYHEIPKDEQHFYERWELKIESTESLMYDKLPANMTLTLFGNRSGSFLPDPSWIGKTAFFEANRNHDNYGLSYPYAISNWESLSPDGNPLYIWQGEPESDLKAIRKVANAGDLRSKESLNQAAKMVEDDAMPLFLRDRIMVLLWLVGIDFKATRDFDAEHFLQWRDSTKFPLDLRLDADFYLADLSPRSYRTVPVRLEFLNSVLNSPAATREQKRQAQYQLTQAKPPA